MFDFALNRPKSTPHIRCALDTETFLIGPCVQAPPAVALGFRLDGGRVNIIMANDPAFDRVVEALFRDPSVRLFGHYVRYDIAVLMAHGARFGKAVEWAQMILGALHDDRVTCTGMRELLYHIALARFSLDGLVTNLGAACERWGTKTQPDKTDPYRKLWGAFAGMHARDLPGGARKYLAEDVIADDELYLAQGAKHGQWLVDEYRQTRASVALYLTQCWGFRSDPVQAAKLYETTARELEDAAALCQAHGLRRPDGTGDKKAAAAHMVATCERLGLSVLRGAATAKMLEKDPDCLGNIKLDAAACERTHDPVMMAYSESTQAAGLLGKVRRWSMPILQPSYDTIKATGRTSVKQGDDPDPGEAPLAHGVQVQNPPKAVLQDCPDCAGQGCEACKHEGEVEVRGIREIMVPRAGHVILDIDFVGMEQCTLAQMEIWLFGRSALAEVLNNPARSALVELGARIIGVSAEEGYALKKTEPKRFKEMRSVAKGPAYGLPGGMGWAKLIEYCWKNYKVRVSPELAKKIAGHQYKDPETGRHTVVPGIVKDLYPERQPYLSIMDSGVCPANKAGAKVSRGSSGWRMTHPYSGRVRGGVGYSDGNNSWFQGLAGDCAKESTWRVVVECYAVPESAMFDSRPLAFVHDQILTETPEPQYVEAAERLEELWVSGAQEICTDVLIQAKPAATRCWSKTGGDPVHWPDGRLAIYEDWLAAQSSAGVP